MRAMTRELAGVGPLWPAASLPAAAVRESGRRMVRRVEAARRGRAPPPGLAGAHPDGLGRDGSVRLEALDHARRDRRLQEPLDLA